MNLSNAINEIIGVHDTVPLPIGESVADLTLEEILEREKLIAAGKVNPEEYVPETKKEENVQEEVLPIITEDIPQHSSPISTIESDGGKLKILLTDGRSFAIDIPTSRVDRIVSGNSVQRPAQVILLSGYEFRMKLNSLSWMYVLNEDGIKCNPSIQWVDKELIITSNVNLDNHILYIG